MISLLANINGLLMVLIALMHLYWAFGGRRGAEQAIPTGGEGKQRVFNPGPATFVVVIAGLFAFAACYFSAGFGFSLPFAKTGWAVAVPAFIFTARAIGDFRYVGFFKKIKDTVFGRFDTRYYSPLCLYLGVSSFVITGYLTFA